jgi:hypothetical protein
MASPRRFQITFRPQERTTYELALDFTAAVHAVVELSETAERFHLRDALDRKSTALAVALSRATNLPLAADRRAACSAALPLAQDCAAMIDIFGARGTIPADVLEAPRAVIRVLIGRMEGLAN